MGMLLLVRHGQASFGADDYDVLSELGAAQGRRLGQALAAEGVTPTLVLHGSLRRQRETAQAMAQAARWRVRLRADPRWDEFDHLDVIAAHTSAHASAHTSAQAAAPGADQARTLDRRGFQEVFEQATAHWIAATSTTTTSASTATPGPDGGPGAGPGAAAYQEPFPDFVDRVGAALRQAAGSVGSGETVVVVSSGGAIAAACGLLTLIPREAAEIATVWQRLNTVMVNASVTRVLVGATGVRLLSFNEHAFLDRGQVSYR